VRDGRDPLPAPVPSAHHAGMHSRASDLLAPLALLCLALAAPLVPARQDAPPAGALQPLGPSEVARAGEVAITWLATIFKKVRLHTHENVGWGKIQLPEETMHTAAYWMTFDDAATKGLGREQVAAGLQGIANLARNLAPVYCMCDPRDIGAQAQVRSPSTLQPTVFLYDIVPGGVGLAERLFEIRDDLADACRSLVEQCACADGCPACVGAQVETKSPAKKAARALLARFAGRS